MRKWPTLEGRLKNLFASELEALEQLNESVVLTDYAKKKLEKLRKKNIIKNKKL